MSGVIHIPVLLEETIEHLGNDKQGIFIDCTVGLGGHAAEILKRNPEAKLIGFDIDESSLLAAKKNLQPFSSRLELYHSDFRYLPDLKLDFSYVAGVLIDLGVSSFQLDTPERGFSYSHQGPLDMRMDLRNKVTAAKIINKCSEHRLAQIFWTYGELRQSKRLASAIVSKRKIKKIETTSQLFEIVEEACRWRHQKGKIHPAAKVFQAIRIEVNQELKGLDEFLEKIAHKIPLRARIAVISFHSLEDRIVKQTFARLASSEDIHPSIKIITKKPIFSSEEEIADNFRARSARLRVGERI